MNDPVTLLWVDVETTSLDPANGHLLEIAIVPTELDPAFTPLGDSFSLVFICPPVKLVDVHPDVLEMHARNGLWRESAKGRPPEKAWNAMRDSMRRWDLANKPVMLAGRSVHFDRSWLDAFAPEHAWHYAQVSHRLFDLTPVKQFAELVGIPFSEPESTHRALEDVLADIQLARELVNDARQHMQAAKRA